MYYTHSKGNAPSVCNIQCIKCPFAAILNLMVNIPWTSLAVTDNAFHY